MSRTSISTWYMSPAASLTPAILGRAERRATVSGAMLHPVLPGTLYRMMGIFTAPAAASKWRNSPSWVGLL
jgi:hypothetical protein